MFLPFFSNELLLKIQECLDRVVTLFSQLVQLLLTHQDLPKFSHPQKPTTRVRSLLSATNAAAACCHTLTNARRNSSRPTKHMKTKTRAKKREIHLSATSNAAADCGFRPTTCQKIPSSAARMLEAATWIPRITCIT